MQRLLLTGASGFLGWNVSTFPQEKWEIWGIYHQSPAGLSPAIKGISLDLTDSQAVSQFFQQHSFDAILHLAALSQPNACAENPILSRKINVEATALLAQIAAKKGIPFIFSSSSQVFDGQHPPYDETAAVSPISIYAKHKIEAEEAVFAHYPKAVVVRMPLMFGETSPVSQNFLKAWLEKMRQGEQLNVFTDEYRTPISGQVAASVFFELLDKPIEGELFHIGSADTLSRAEFAFLMQEIFELPDAHIQTCLQSDVKMAAQRPKDLSINSSKLTAFIGYKPPKVKDELIKLKGKV